MLNLAGLTPTVLASAEEGARLRWQIDGRAVETDFDRFRPIALGANSDDTRLDVTWRDFGDLPMTDHFFKISSDRAAALSHAAASFQTDFDTLSTMTRQPDALPFSGAIFHMARTGSTLIHRLFSRTGKVHSLSEVTLFDEATRLIQDWPPDQRNAALRDLIGVYRRPRRPNEQYFIAKMTDAMASIRLPIYRDAFPETPWIFVYRDPVEVMVSILRRPTGSVHSWFDNRTHASERLRMPVLADPSMWTNEFVARTLQRFCQNAIEAAKATPAGKFLAVSYKRLPDAVWETIAPHFGVELSDRDRHLMRDEAQYSSKKIDPTEFRPDSERKQEAASPDVIDLAKRFVAPLLEELKSLPQG